MSDQWQSNRTRSIGAFLIAAAMLLAALSLWTVIPLAWLWIGSQVAETQFPSVGPYAIVFIGVVVSILIVAWILGKLNQAYLRLTGSSTVEPIRLGWMRGLTESSLARPPSVLEAVIVGSVIIAIIALAFWFFTLAGSPVG